MRYIKKCAACIWQNTSYAPPSMGRSTAPRPTADGSARRAPTPHLFDYLMHTYELPRDLSPRSAHLALARAVDRRAQNAYIGEKQKSHGDRPGERSTHSPSKKIAQNDQFNHTQYQGSTRLVGGHCARERMRARRPFVFDLSHFPGVT